MLSAGTLMGTGPPNPPRLDTWHRLCDVPPPSSVSPNFMVEQEPDGGRETPLPLLLCVCLLGALANQQSCIPACRPGAAQSPHNHSGLVVRPCRPASRNPAWPVSPCPLLAARPCSSAGPNSAPARSRGHREGTHPLHTNAGSLPALFVQPLAKWGAVDPLDEP